MIASNNAILQCFFHFQFSLIIHIFNYIERTFIFSLRYPISYSWSSGGFTQSYLRDALLFIVSIISIDH